jgi:hypothetical protein
MLFYVYLFAMRQTHSRQSAWFRSFVMWFVFEVAVSSTGLVVLTHLMIPLFVLADVSKVKAKILKDLTKFREKYLKGGRRIKPVARPREEFNAAKYLFPSWRLASLFPGLPESPLILEYRTIWPKKSFQKQTAAVSREYDQDIVMGALSQIVVFFLSSFLRFHTLVQDIIVQTVCNSGLGMMCLWMIRLFAINPFLGLAPVVVVAICLHFLLRACTPAKNSRERTTVGAVYPIEEDEDDEKEDEQEEGEREMVQEVGELIPPPLENSAPVIEEPPLSEDESKSQGEQRVTVVPLGRDSVSSSDSSSTSTSSSEKLLSVELFRSFFASSSSESGSDLKVNIHSNNSSSSSVVPGVIWLDEEEEV